MAAYEGVVSDVEKQFALQALTAGLRIDGRSNASYRKIGVKCRRRANETTVEVMVGKTKCCARVAAEVVPPYPDRGAEGFINFSVDFSPMAGPQYEAERPPAAAAAIARMLERMYKDARALDTEALCIVPGRRVWSVDVSVLVLNDDGNVADAVFLAAGLALQHFRRAAVTVSGEHVVVHNFDERVPEPLSVHYMPVLVTMFIARPDRAASMHHTTAEHDSEEQAGELAPFVDANAVEELTTTGKIHVATNEFGEVCGLTQAGGSPLGVEEFMDTVVVALQHGKRLLELVNSVLTEADLLEAQRARARHEAAAGYTSGHVRLAQMAEVMLGEVRKGSVPKPAESKPVVGAPLPGDEPGREYKQFVQQVTASSLAAPAEHA